MTAVVVAVALALAVALAGAGRRPRDRLRAAGALRAEPGSRRRGGAGRTVVIVAVVLLVAVAVAHIPPPVVVVAAAATAAASRQVTRARHRRAVVAAEAATVETVFALAAELRAGRPPGRAIGLVAEAAGPLSDSLGEAAAAVNAGAPAADELLRLARRPGCGGFRGVAAAWEVTVRVGGPVADVLDRLAEVLDADRRARDSLSAALAGPRTTMLVLAGLPVVGVVLGQSLGAHPVDFLMHRPVGWALGAGAVGLDLAGLGWTALLVRRAWR